MSWCSTSMRDQHGRPLGGPRMTNPGGARTPQRTRAEERIEELDVSPTKLLADIEQLKGELAASQAKADEFLAALQRGRAEFPNSRRRTSEEREARLGLAGEDLIRKVLAIADDFDLAIENRPAELAGDARGEGGSDSARKSRRRA